MKNSELAQRMLNITRFLSTAPNDSAILHFRELPTDQWQPIRNNVGWSPFVDLNQFKWIEKPL